MIWANILRAMDGCGFTGSQLPSPVILGTQTKMARPLLFLRSNLGWSRTGENCQFRLWVPGTSSEAKPGQARVGRCGMKVEPSF